MTLVRILDEFENCNRDRREKEKTENGQKQMRKIKNNKTNDNT